VYLCVYLFVCLSDLSGVERTEQNSARECKDMYTKWSVLGGLLSVDNCVDLLPSVCVVIRNVV
jgi:hypothetical protein